MTDRNSGSLADDKTAESMLVADSAAAPGSPSTGSTRPRVPKVNVKAQADGSYALSVGDDSKEDFLKLMDALGVTQRGVITGYLSQVINSVSKSGPVEETYQFAFGFIQSIEPTNEVEAALAAQMAAVHIASMDTSRRLLQAGSQESFSCYERAVNKLMRTYTTQMEALKRHRSKAQQVVRVERVTVEEGAQAIVGDVHHGGRVDDEK